MNTVNTSVICPDGFNKDIIFCWQISTDFRLPVLQRNRRDEKMEATANSSKSHRVRDLLPSVKPSYLSLSLVFICVFLLLRNESTNFRLLALEKQMKVLSTRECCVETGSNVKREEIFDRPLLDSGHIFARKIKILVAKKLDYTSGKNNLKIY